MFSKPIVPDDKRKWDRNFQYLRLRPQGSSKSLFPVKSNSRRALRRQRGRREGEVITPVQLHEGDLVLTCYQVKMARSIERFVKENPDKFSNEPFTHGMCAWYFYPDGAPSVTRIDHV